MNMTMTMGDFGVGAPITKPTPKKKMKLLQGGEVVKLRPVSTQHVHLYECDIECGLNGPQLTLIPFKHFHQSNTRTSGQGIGR